MAAEQPKLRGAVREVGLSRDGDRFDNFTVTIGIHIRTEGRVTYEEAEKLATRYRREYLGKEVEFLSVNLPCPVCGKILNSEVGLKGHIRQSHPERLDLINNKEDEKPASKKAVKTVKAAKATAKKPAAKKGKTGKTKKSPAKAAQPKVKAKITKTVKPPAPKAIKVPTAKSEPSKSKNTISMKAETPKAKPLKEAPVLPKTKARLVKAEEKPAAKPAKKLNGRQQRLF